MNNEQIDKLIELIQGTTTEIGFLGTQTFLLRADELLSLLVLARSAEFWQKCHKEDTFELSSAYKRTLDERRNDEMVFAELERVIYAKDQRINVLEETIRKFLMADGHELCWENRMELYKVLGDRSIEAGMPFLVSRKEFEEGCKNYANKIYGERK